MSLEAPEFLCFSEILTAGTCAVRPRNKKTQGVKHVCSFWRGSCSGQARHSMSGTLVRTGSERCSRVMGKLCAVPHVRPRQVDGRERPGLPLAPQRPPRPCPLAAPRGLHTDVALAPGGGRPADAGGPRQRRLRVSQDLVAPICQTLRGPESACGPHVPAAEVSQYLARGVLCRAVLWRAVPCCAVPCRAMPWRSMPCRALAWRGVA